MIKFSALVILSITAGVASAQGLSSLGLSTTCQSTIGSLIANAEVSRCLNVPGLLAFATTSGNSSLVQPINTWLTGLCAAEPCSNATVEALAVNITSGCSSDLQNAGVAESAFPNIQQAISTYYPVVRKIACLKTSSSNTLCVTSTLRDIETYFGQPLSISGITTYIPQTIAGAEDIPSNITCTDCIQAAYSVLKEDVPSLITSSVDSSVQAKCGAGFISGGIPSSVAEGTGAAAPTGAASNTNDAVTVLGNSAWFGAFAAVAASLVFA